MSAKNFLKDENQFLIIDGPAGTGKTTLISNLIDETNKLGLSSDAVAYTGKAASNLRNKCKGKGKTIHNFLYKFQPRQSDDLFLRGWVINDIQLDILFVDESSMISSLVEGFNVDKKKTYLLEELLTAVKNKRIKKIILVGDSFQLPPIIKISKKNENKSVYSLYPDSLSEDFIKSRYNLTGSTMNLTTNKRYSTNLNSYNLSTMLREEIFKKESSNYSPKKWLKSNDKNINYISNDKDVIDWVIEKGEKLNFSNVRILTYTNEKAEEWNRKIRKALGKIDITTGEVGEVTENEPLMNLVNKEYSEFYNGDTFIIKEFIEQKKKLSGGSTCDLHPSCKDKENRPSSLTIAKAKVQIINENANEEKIIQIINRGIKANDNSIIESYNHRLWCDFATRNHDLYKNRNKSEENFENWNIARSNDENYGSGIVSYAYASTVHKTQGDSFSFVVIDLEDEDKDLKWLYTSLTRATEDVVFYKKKNRLFFN